MVIIEYPKLVYKTRTDYKTVNSLEEEEAVLSLGYGDYSIVVLGKKPDGVVDDTAPEVVEKPKRSRPLKRNE